MFTDRKIAAELVRLFRKIGLFYEVEKISYDEYQISFDWDDLTKEERRIVCRILEG